LQSHGNDCKEPETNPVGMGYLNWKKSNGTCGMLAQEMLDQYIGYISPIFKEIELQPLEMLKTSKKKHVHFMGSLHLFALIFCKAMCWNHLKLVPCI